MFTHQCTVHHTGTAADARARMTVTTLAINASWNFVTKPYGDQRPSGAPPG